MPVLGAPPLALRAIRSFGTPLRNETGLVELPWQKPGDAIPFEMKLDLEGDARQVRAEVWTNANHNDAPDRFDAIPMRLIGGGGGAGAGGEATFRADVPILNIGNYRAAARVSVDGGRSYQWISGSNIADVRFRPRDEAHDALNIMLVNVGMANCDPATRTYGTFADMMEEGSPETNGKYTLSFLKQQGVNAIWLQGLFEITKWEHRHPLDDAGSPYAARDYFSVRRELTRAARGLEGDEAWAASIAEFDAFKKKCDALGIKLIVDIAPNHVGHNYEFRDLFVRYEQAGREIREVRKNDFSQVAINPEQLGVIQRRLADPNIPKYMEYLAPHMYGKYGDAHGAQSVEETAPGGWFEWPDTKQLNHGRMRWGYHWWDVTPTAETEKVLDWLGRAMRFWAVDRGVHGFRLDHLTGMPERFLEKTLNEVQADVDRHERGKNLFLVGEDFHTHDISRHWLDNEQGGFFHEMRRVRNPAHFRWVVESPWNHDVLALGSHDEDRFIHAFEGDRQAATRMMCLLQLIGGPVLSVMGDEFGEWEKLNFKQYTSVPSIRSANEVAENISKWKARAGLARLSLPALKDAHREWLVTRAGGDDPDLLAVARFAAHEAAVPVLVFGNFNNNAHRANVFRLGAETARRLDPEKRYQVYDAMADDRRAGLWPEPKTGRELIDQGVYVALRPYQIQVLSLREA